MPEFEEVFDELYVTTGKKFLWDNVIHVEEELMMKRRDDAELERGQKVLKGLKRQIDARLVFDGFINAIELDYANALEEDSNGE